MTRNKTAFDSSFHRITKHIRMGIRCIMGLALLAVLTVHAQERNAATLFSEGLAETLLENKVPGIAIATIENDRTEYLTAGVNHLRQPITTSTVFDVASLTKSITTLVTLKWVQEGQWNLDTPLGTYWVDPDVKDDPRHRKLTSRHVLGHRTGFKNWRYQYEDKKLAFDFDPGEKFQYSGEGFEYLRRALEGKFETSLTEMADSLIFRPHEMHRTYLVWNEKMAEQRFAGTHDKQGAPYDYEKSFHANAADNLLTTVADLAHFGKGLLGPSALEINLFNEMIQPQSNVREGIDFGLGWIVFNDLPDDEYALFNAGSDKGVNALIVLLPKSNRGLVVLTNGDNGRALAMKSIAVLLGDAGKEILGRFQ